MPEQAGSSGTGSDTGRGQKGSVPLVRLDAAAVGGAGAVGVARRPV